MRCLQQRVIPRLVPVVKADVMHKENKYKHMMLPSAPFDDALLNPMLYDRAWEQIVKAKGSPFNVEIRRSCIQ